MANVIEESPITVSPESSGTGSPESPAPQHPRTHFRRSILDELNAASDKPMEGRVDDVDRYVESSVASTPHSEIGPNSLQASPTSEGTYSTAHHSDWVSERSAHPGREGWPSLETHHAVPHPILGNTGQRPQWWRNEGNGNPGFSELASLRLELQASLEEIDRLTQLAEQQATIVQHKEQLLQEAESRIALMQHEFSHALEKERRALRERDEECSRLRQNLLGLHRLEAEVEEKAAMEAELSRLLKEKVHECVALQQANRSLTEKIQLLQTERDIQQHNSPTAEEHRVRPRESFGLMEPVVNSVGGWRPETPTAITPADVSQSLDEHIELILQQKLERWMEERENKSARSDSARTAPPTGRPLPTPHPQAALPTAVVRSSRLIKPPDPPPVQRKTQSITLVKPAPQPKVTTRPLVKPMEDTRRTKHPNDDARVSPVIPMAFRSSQQRQTTPVPAQPIQGPVTTIIRRSSATSASKESRTPSGTPVNTVTRVVTSVTTPEDRRPRSRSAPQGPQPPQPGTLALPAPTTRTITSKQASPVLK